MKKEPYDLALLGLCLGVSAEEGVFVDRLLVVEVAARRQALRHESGSSKCAQLNRTSFIEGSQT